MRNIFSRKVKKIKFNLKITNLLIGIIISLAAIVVLFFGTLCWGIYKMEWHNPALDQILAYLPLPAARVNGVNILFPDYFKNLAIAKKFYDKQKQANFPNLPGEEQLKKIIMEDRLVTNSLVYELAGKYNITVSQGEIDARIDEIIKNKGSQEETEKFLKDYYDLDLAGYKKYFIEPNLYYDKTNEAIIDDDSINGESKKNIQAALNDLRNGKDFDEVAKQYTVEQDINGPVITEGFLRGELPKEIEDQLFNMKEGEYTDVLTIADRLAIFKLRKKDEDKGALTLGKIVVKVQTINELLEQEKNKAQIKIWAY